MPAEGRGGPSSRREGGAFSATGRLRLPTQGHAPDASSVTSPSSPSPASPARTCASPSSSPAPCHATCAGPSSCTAEAAAWHREATALTGHGAGQACTDAVITTIQVWADVVPELVVQLFLHGGQRRALPGSISAPALVCFPLHCARWRWQAVCAADSPCSTGRCIP